MPFQQMINDSLSFINLNSYGSYYIATSPPRLARLVLGKPLQVLTPSGGGSIPVIVVCLFGGGGTSAMGIVGSGNIILEFWIPIVSAKKKKIILPHFYSLIQFLFFSLAFFFFFIINFL